jgi:hypothetical protein
MPRRADAVAAVSSLLIDILQDIIQHAPPFRDAPRGEALQLIVIMAYVVVTTREGMPRNQREIARALNIRRETVAARLRTLASGGRLTIIASDYEHRYAANLDFYDASVTPARIDGWQDMIARAGRALADVRENKQRRA